MLFHHSLFLLCKGHGHLLSVSKFTLKVKSSYQKAKGEFITYQCRVKIKFDQWNKLILLTAEQIPEKYNHCMQQFHLLWTEKHKPPLYSFCNRLWSTRVKESSNCTQMSPDSIYVCRSCTDSKQNNQHHTSSAQEKILGTTSKWKATRICSIFVIIIQVTNTQDII